MFHSGARNVHIQRTRTPARRANKAAAFADPARRRDTGGAFAVPKDASPRNLKPTPPRSAVFLLEYICENGNHFFRSSTVIVIYAKDGARIMPGGVAEDPFAP